jgi:NADPH:quinone reductase-like Zn-dependent oxidoreductase
MKSLQVNTHANKVDGIKIELVEMPMPQVKPGECLIKVVASGINPSDALATMGYFKHAGLPRIPGRDFSGVVVEGPASWLGKNVWGTGGAAGISYNGTQAEYICLPVEALSKAPSNMDIFIASAQPLPYVTAYYSLVERARINAGESVLVVGALGQVGKAAMSICQWKQGKPIALVKGKESLVRAKSLGWNAINSDEDNLAEKILAANHGQPIQVILNSVGNIYWQSFMQSLDECGRIVTIGARENVREAMVNLFELYRANQEIIGVNTVSFDFAKNAQWLNELRKGFEENQLKPLEVSEKIYMPEQASEAYQSVMKGDSGSRRVIKIQE